MAPAAIGLSGGASESPAWAKAIAGQPTARSATRPSIVSTLSFNDALPADAGHGGQSPHIFDPPIVQSCGSRMPQTIEPRLHPGTRHSPRQHRKRAGRSPRRDRAVGSGGQYVDASESPDRDHGKAMGFSSSG